MLHLYILPVIHSNISLFDSFYYSIERYYKMNQKGKYQNESLTDHINEVSIYLCDKIKEISYYMGIIILSFHRPKTNHRDMSEHKNIYHLQPMYNVDETL